MVVTLFYFAKVREALRHSSETIEMKSGWRVGDLLHLLEERHSEFAGIGRSIRVAVNQEFVGNDYVLHDGDEVALIPPVSGGA